jgi:hypothetical protein
MNEKVEVQAQDTAPVDPVFPRFFRDGEEPQPKLVGLIAYGLYEEARREWVDAFKGREGRFPLAEEVRAYENSWTASRLEGLKNAAVQVLASYADTLAREIENQALRRALRGSFFRSGWRWLVSAVLFAAVVLGVMVALNRAGIDPIATFQSLLHPSDTASPTPSADSRPPPAPNAETSAPAVDTPAPPAPNAPAQAPNAAAPVPPARPSGR